MYMENLWIRFDEMAIKEQIDFDTSTKAYIGNVTLPGNTYKALLFQLFGLGFHWKQYIAYLFTPFLFSK